MTRMSIGAQLQDMTRPKMRTLAPHMALSSNSILPHWVVRDTMTSATLIPRFRKFTFLHTFFNLSRALSAAFVGLLLYVVEFIAIACSTFHNPFSRCSQPVTPPASPPRSEPIAALLELRPCNGSVGEPVQRCAQLATVEWRTVPPEKATNLRAGTCKSYC